MRESIIKGNIYHVLNRGVDKRKIFLETGDYLRFIHDLFIFNDQNPINNTTYYFEKLNSQFKSKDFASHYFTKKKRKLLVKILAFCLMPNHYHLLLMPLTDDGIFRFMKKLNMGYAKFFNDKYQRSGALFEGRYKLVPVLEENHFLHLPIYIHFNPLDLIMPEWRLGKIKNQTKALEFLEKYRWSSHLDYLGKKNFPSITQREFLLEIFDGPQKYEENIKSYLKEMEFSDTKEISLE